MTAGRSALTPSIIACLVIPPFLWAGNAMVGRLLNGRLPPFEFNALRWLLALALLLPFGWRVFATRPARALIAERWKWIAALSFCGVGAYNSLQYLALTTSTPINITLIAASLPVWMLAIGAVAFGQRPARAGALGAVLSLLGVVVVLTQGEVRRISQFEFVRGDLYMLAAVAIWAVYSWLLSDPRGRWRGAAWPVWSPVQFLFIQAVFGIVWCLLATGLEAMVVAPPPVDWSDRAILAGIAYTAIGPAIVAYLCWGRGVALAGPAAAGFFFNLTPAFVAVMSTLVTGEHAQPYHGVAFMLIVAGIVVSSWRRASPVSA
ncbi:DMT family transporter [soil metagenome]